MALGTTDRNSRYDARPHVKINNKIVSSKETKKREKTKKKKEKDQIRNRNR